MSRTGPATCARSCGSLVQLTYPWPVYTKDTSTRFRSWPDMAMVNCRRSRREWLRAAYRLYGVLTMPRVFTSSVAKSPCSKAGKFLLPVPILSRTPLSQQRPATAKSCVHCSSLWTKKSTYQHGALGMRTTARGAIDLSGIVVTAENMVGMAGDFMRQPYFSEPLCLA